MKSSEASTLDLIARAKDGDDYAMEKLMMIIRDHHMMPRIKRQFGRNVLVEDAEIESHFLEGCYRAVKQAKMDIGNPLLFILWKGQLSVARLFRKQIREGVRLHCNACNSTTFGYHSGHVECGSCTSRDVQTQMVLMNESQLRMKSYEGEREMVWDRLITQDMHDEMDLLFSEVTYDIQVQEIRARLNGRPLQLFDAMIIEGINRETSKNYIAEIATKWGVSTTAVAIYLRKLRAVIEDYYTDPDNNLDSEESADAA